MKKITALFLALLMASLLTVAVADEVADTYTGASLTKSYVTGDEAAALAKVLETSGADIATTAQAAAPDYVKEYGLHVQIITVNPDGCPGLSTIGYWRYANNRADGRDAVITAGDWTFTKRGEGADQVVFQLTDGQNAQNLFNAGIGGRSTLLVKVENATYLLHLNTTEIFAQEFTQEAYDAGEFATGYSGADRQATSFYFVCDVLSIEKSFSILMH